MMTTESPGVRPVTWVTLGFLAVSALLTEYWTIGFGDPRVWQLEQEHIKHLVIVAPAHVVWFLVTITGRRFPAVSWTAVCVALVFSFFSGLLAVQITWRILDRMRLDDVLLLVRVIQGTYLVAFIAGYLLVWWVDTRIRRIPAVEDVPA